MKSFTWNNNKVEKTLYYDEFKVIGVGFLYENVDWENYRCYQYFDICFTPNLDFPFISGSIIKSDILCIDLLVDIYPYDKEIVKSWYGLEPVEYNSRRKQWQEDESDHGMVELEKIRMRFIEECGCGINYFK